METERAATVKFHGRVQGVYFRMHTQREAQRLGLKGWVRNVNDGSVEAYFEGPEEVIQKAVSYCRREIPMADVKFHQVAWSEPTSGFAGFDIRH